MNKWLVGSICWLGLGALILEAGPVEEIAGYSVLSKEKIEEAVSGDIQSTRGPGFNLRRGIQTQMVFRSKLAPEAVAAALEQWDPTNHPELGTALHQTLTEGKTAESFQMLVEQANVGLVARLLPSVTNAVNHEGRWPLLSDEQTKLNKAQPENNEKAARWLAEFLKRRSDPVLKGGLRAGLGLPIDGQLISPAEEINALVNETPEIAKQFTTLISNATKGQGTSGRGYWEVFRVDRDPAVCLGQVWKAKMEGKVQILDAQYFVSTGYNVNVTLYEIFPLENGSLIWRGDYLSASMLSSTQGMERMAFASIMQKETKKAAEAFLQDLDSNK